MPGATVPAAHAVWSVIQSEDGYAWHAQLNWDNGRQDRVLRFESQQAAEAWLRDEVTKGAASSLAGGLAFGRGQSWQWEK